MPIDKETEDKIAKYIEWHEYMANGMKWVNGACVDVEDLEIDEDENEIRCKVTLDFQADQRQEVFNNCQYPLDKVLERLHLVA